MTQRTPAEVFSPGEFVKDELEERGWSQADLAEILGRPPRLVSEIVTGKRSITPETARGLAAAFGTDPQLWLNLESAYQLSRVKQTDDAVARRARLYALVPMKELVRRQWIEQAENIDVLEQRVRAFLGIESLDEPLTFRAAARSSIKPSPAQCVWLARARQLARMVQASKFTKSSVDSVVAKLRALLPNAEETRNVPRMLAEVGIRLVIIEPLPQTRIDGACFWPDRLSPVVALSLRFDRIDAFWFTLFHELAHVKNDDGKEGALILDVDLAGEHAQGAADKTGIEGKANKFASESLIPAKDLDGFIARVRPLYSKQKITGFANRIHVHPGIVVGRLQFLKEIPYAHSREMLGKVRDFVLESSLTDGWGSFVPATL